jgi:hypothetical protein
MITLAREFDACGECRLDVGGPAKYRNLTNEEIIEVVEALESRDELVALLNCVATNLEKGMSKSIQRMQAKTIRNALKEALT